MSPPRGDDHAAEAESGAEHQERDGGACAIDGDRNGRRDIGGTFRTEARGIAQEARDRRSQGPADALEGRDRARGDVALALNGKPDDMLGEEAVTHAEA